MIAQDNMDVERARHALEDTGEKSYRGRENRTRGRFQRIHYMTKREKFVFLLQGDNSARSERRRRLKLPEWNIERNTKLNWT